jgi:sporulation protein YlmC with PRC-barrel domain
MEAQMRADLGMDVYAADGEKVGQVERLVLDTTTREIDKLIVARGLLTRHEKLVDIDMVTGQDDDGLQIDLTSAQFDELPDFVQERFTIATERETAGLPYAIAPGTGGGAIVFGATTAGRGYDARGSLFEAAPAAQPIVETRSNVPEQDVMIDEGTEVVAADGKKFGNVGEVFFRENGQISGFTVKGGLFRDDLRVPIDWVGDAGADRITLTVTSTEAETRSFDIEDSSL